MVPHPLKTCAKCRTAKPATTEHFHAHKHTRDKLGSYCKPCQIATNSENRRQRKVTALGKPKPTHCPLCGHERELVYDHDHATGAARDWICGKCNPALGLANDDPALLRKMAKYIEHHRKKFAEQSLTV